MSAADQRHYRSLLQLLRSIERHDPARTLQRIVYDLGLTPLQRSALTTRFPAVEVRDFELARLPGFMQLRARPINSNAWKPQLIERVLAEASGSVLWLDSATVLLRHPAPELSFIAHTGFYTPFGGHSSIARWTHPACAERLGMRTTDLTPRMRASGVFGAHPAHPVARALVAEWAIACSDEACVAPDGATRDNHNFDQSVLNILLLRAKAQANLTLTADELDISSSSPVAFLRSRNKVHVGLPLWLDPLVRAGYRAYRALDIHLLRLRRSHFCPAHLRDTPEFSSW